MPNRQHTTLTFRVLTTDADGNEHVDVVNISSTSPFSRDPACVKRVGEAIRHFYSGAAKEYGFHMESFQRLEPMAIELVTPGDETVPLMADSPEARLVVAGLQAATTGARPVLRLVAPGEPGSQGSEDPAPSPAVAGTLELPVQVDNPIAAAESTPQGTKPRNGSDGYIAIATAIGVGLMATAGAMPAAAAELMSLVSTSISDLFALAQGT